MAHEDYVREQDAKAKRTEGNQTVAPSGTDTQSPSEKADPHHKKA